MADTGTLTATFLLESDVPGARLTSACVENHSNIQLKRWLRCRSLKATGKKEELVERVKTCISSGMQNKIDNAIDGGKWYDFKRSSNSQLPMEPSVEQFSPTATWTKFPSKKIPTFFNEGHIHHHVVESMQTFHSEVVFGADDVEECGGMVDVHTAKPLSKGKSFFTSGHVKDVMDNESSTHYFLKSNVMSSYNTSKTYTVSVVITRVSGFVAKASCHCKASALGRCNHVAALLFALLDYTEKHGFDPVSCTSLPCSWNTGRSKDKQPKKVQSAVYPSFKRKRLHTVADEVDVRPSDLRSPDPQERAMQLLNGLHALRADASSSKPCMWETILYYKYKEYQLSDDRQSELQTLAEIMVENLSVGDPQFRHFPVKIVEQQVTDDWFRLRSCRITASECKRVIGLKNAASVYTYLKNKLWYPKVFSTSATKYGISNEPQAREQYADMNPTSIVIETGMWVNPKWPQCGASPDALVREGAETGLLEIKCPWIVRNNQPDDLNALPPKSKATYCLAINKGTGGVQLRRSHQYYFQVQMQLGVTGLSWCDFLVWSKHGTFVERIHADEKFWHHQCSKLVAFHRKWLAPEYFEMRVPRRLLPFEL